MNRDRFIAILHYLKVCDEEVKSQSQQVAPDQPPAQPDKLYKVRHFLDQLLPRISDMLLSGLAINGWPLTSR